MYSVVYIRHTIEYIHTQTNKHTNPCAVYRYDVEVYQRIEQLIGKQLPVYPTVEEEAMALMERVTEAQRLARMVSGLAAVIL